VPLDAEGKSKPLFTDSRKRTGIEVDLNDGQWNQLVFDRAAAISMQDDGRKWCSTITTPESTRRPSKALPIRFQSEPLLHSRNYHDEDDIEVLSRLDRPLSAQIERSASA
jgi:hypothetical protein